METTWPTQFDTVLRGFLPMLDTDVPLTDDLNLAGAGLDSLATVSLLLDLEDTFEVTFPDDMLTAATFATPATLWAALADLVQRE